MFNNIKSLRPYFFSLREIESNVSLDIKIPLLWKYEEITKPYRSVNIKVQDKSEKVTLISIISNATQDGYDVAFACALEIIKQNKEDEEKRVLFQKKIKELEKLFQNETLEKLKDLTFNETHEQENIEGEGKDVGGGLKITEASREQQTEND